MYIIVMGFKEVMKLKQVTLSTLESGAIFYVPEYFGNPDYRVVAQFPDVQSTLVVKNDNSTIRTPILLPDCTYANVDVPAPNSVSFDMQLDKSSYNIYMTVDSCRYFYQCVEQGPFSNAPLDKIKVTVMYSGVEVSFLCSNIHNEYHMYGIEYFSYYIKRLIGTGATKIQVTLTQVEE